MSFTAIPVNTICGNSHVILVADTDCTLKAVATCNGRCLATDYRWWKTFKGRLAITRQMNDRQPTFEMLERQEDPSWRNHYQFKSDRLVTFNFASGEIDCRDLDNDVSIDLINYDNVLFKYRYAPCPFCSVEYHSDSPDVKHVYLENENCEQNVELRFRVRNTDPAMIYMPAYGNVSARFLIIDRGDNEQANVINVIFLGDKKKEKSLIKYACSSSICPHYRNYAKGVCVSMATCQLSAVVFEGQLYLLETYDGQRYSKATAVWRLGLDDQWSTASWLRIPFREPVDLGLGSIFIINDAGEVLLVRNLICRDKTRPDDVSVVLCLRLKVPTLQQLAARAAIITWPTLITISDSDRAKIGIPSGVLPDCSWLNNFKSKPGNIAECWY